MFAKRKVGGAVAFALPLATTTAAIAGGPFLPSVIYSNIQTSDTSLVPGLGGTRFTASNTFDWTSLRASPDGNWWVLNAQIGDDNGGRAMLRGFGTNGTTGEVFASVGDNASIFGIGDRALQTLDVLADVTNAGFVGYAGDLDGGGADDDFIVTWNGTSHTLVARETGDASAVFGPGTTWRQLDTVQVLEDQTVGFRGALIQGTPGGTNTDQAYILGNSVLFQEEGLPAPSGQAGGASETWDIIDIEGLRLDATGSNYIARGDLHGLTNGDDVVVVNNVVVAQEGSTVGSFTSPIQVGPHSIEMTGNADWFVHASNFDGTDWIMRNSSIIAASGVEIYSGAGENWGITGTNFFLMTGNQLGDYVVGGNTAGGDAVLVLNGMTELLREGDAVDLDGNGLLDDGVFIDEFYAGDAFFSDSRILHALVGLSDDAGTHVGQAMISVAIPAPGALALFILAGACGRRRRAES